MRASPPLIGSVMAVTALCGMSGCGKIAGEAAKRIAVDAAVGIAVHEMTQPADANASVNYSGYDPYVSDPYGTTTYDPYATTTYDPYGTGTTYDPYGTGTTYDLYGTGSTYDPYGTTSDPYGTGATYDPYGTGSTYDPYGSIPSIDYGTSNPYGDY